MTNDNSTKRPWKISSGTIICDDKGRVLAQCAPIGIENFDVTLEEAEANAKLIVKCVNEYDNLKEGIDRRTIEIARQQAIIDELVEALKELNSNNRSDCNDRNCCQCTQCKVKQSLDKAESEPIK